MLAVVLGLGTWWGIGVYSEPHPLWTIRFSSPKDIMLPMCESVDGNRIGVYELQLPQRQTSSSTLTALSILDARNGAKLYRLSLQEKTFVSDDDYLSLHWAQPRILGDILWRLTKTTTETEVRIELRAWHFTQSEQENVVHVWKSAPGKNFEIAFADRTSPYFITQTAEPWEPLLVGMGVDGWTRILASIAFTQERNTQNVLLVKRSQASFLKRGLVLPRIQTWKLLTSIDEPLQRLATWNIPPMRIAWPPACATDLHWMAFGDVESNQEWNVDLPNSRIKPSGVLLYDGQTGIPRPLGTRDDVTIRASAAGELLLLSSNYYVFSQRAGTTEHTAYDGNTGKKLAWPEELKHPFMPKDLLADPTNPGRYLALMGMLADPFMTSRTLSEETQRILHLQRTEQGFTLVKDVTLQPQPGQVLMFPAHFSGSEMGVYATVDTIPPFLAPLMDKWDWAKTYVQKIWPRHVPALLIYDIDTGKQVRQLLHLVPSINITSANMKMQFTSEMATDLQPGSLGFLDLAAWQLPITAQAWSPWWGRIAGVLVFAIATLFLKQRRQH